MSWQGYVDSLMGSNHMTSCGIFGLDGSKWASSAVFPITTEGVQLVIASVQDPSKMSNGLVVGDDKFILIRSDPGVALILKKGALGVVAYKSSQAVIIGMHDGTVKAEVVLTDIGRMADYLIKHGY